MLLIIILVMVDLGIKAVIYFNFMNVRIRFYNDTFGFVPFINTEQASMFNLEFGMGVSTIHVVVLNTILLAVMLFVYYRVYIMHFMNRHVKVILCLFIAATICSIIDKVTLGGSLDYLLIKYWIIDLKDFYLFVAAIYGVIAMLASGVLTNSTKCDVEFIKKLLGINRS